VLSFAQKTDLFFWGSQKNAKEVIFVHFFYVGIGNWLLLFGIL